MGPFPSWYEQQLYDRQRRELKYRARQQGLAGLQGPGAALGSVYAAGYAQDPLAYSEYRRDICPPSSPPDPPKKKLVTIRAELQSEINEWLRDIK